MKLNFDNFELFYQKFSNIKEEEESLGQHKNDINNPYFISNYNYE